MTDLFAPFELPNGKILKNRLIKSAMSDSLGDGRGTPTPEQNNLYSLWAQGGVAASIIGEVQGTPHYPERPGNLVIHDRSDLAKFQSLAKAGSLNNTQLWAQLGHGGALSYEAVSSPKGPSALDLDGLVCGEMSVDEIKSLPAEFAKTARTLQRSGFGGVQIHAAHGFLLNQFLSPLFNRRTDRYGGPLSP